MHEFYVNPLCSRYSGEETRRCFSDDNKFRTWRRLWIALAESERELGLPITEGQIDEMRLWAQDIDYNRAAEIEKNVRHDVMAHVRAYGEQCPAAKPIIHLGATSSFVGDNTDIILQRQAIRIIKKLLINAIDRLADFAERYKSLPVLGFTHFQSAQPTTLGKRAALWINDLLMDLETLEFVNGRLKFLGCKGATGTAASFLELFNGDHGKVLELERRIADKLGFGKDEIITICSQTYSRKLDFTVLSALSGIAQSAHKFANDIRLLSHLKEVEEPFEDGQIGSSAMAYKRNPVRSERMTALARHVIALAQDAAMTASEQWLERTLDDSANRRISIPEAFLGTDAVLSLFINISQGLNVYPKVIEKHIRTELPFMATENVLMRSVQKGGDRQSLHESIRKHSMEAVKDIKLEGLDNTLIERIMNDPDFNLTSEEMADILNPDGLTGRAKEQTEEFLLTVRDILNKNKDLIGYNPQINV